MSADNLARALLHRTHHDGVSSAATLGRFVGPLLDASLDHPRMDQTDRAYRLLPTACYAGSTHLGGQAIVIDKAKVVTVVIPMTTVFRWLVCCYGIYDAPAENVLISDDVNITSVPRDSLNVFRPSTFHHGCNFWVRIRGCF